MPDRMWSRHITTECYSRFLELEPMLNLTGNTIKPYTVWQICEIYEHFQADALQVCRACRIIMIIGLRLFMQEKMFCITMSEIGC